MQAQRVEKQMWRRSAKEKEKKGEETTILTVRSLIGPLKEQQRREWWLTFRALGNAL